MFQCRWSDGKSDYPWTTISVEKVQNFLTHCGKDGGTADEEIEKMKGSPDHLSLSTYRMYRFVPD